MPPKASDRPRVILIAIAATSLALAAFAHRSVNAATAVAGTPLPPADIQSIAAYLSPLPDTFSLAEAGTGTMVVQRDPFGAAASSGGMRNSGSGSGTGQVRPPAVEGRQWVVSSILIEDSRRSAIVNNAWVAIGDPLGGGARLSAIERKHVVIIDANGVRHIVPIQGGEP